MAMPDRQEEYEISFPNIIGYRMENMEGELLYDFSRIENYEIDGSVIPVETTLGTAVSNEEIQIRIQNVLEKRDSELFYWLTKELISFHFSDEEGNHSFHKFSRLKKIVEEWYNTKVLLLNITDKRFKRLLFFHEPKKIADHIARGINPQHNSIEFVRPVFNYYNKFGSSNYVNGNTVKEVYPTVKSHVNFVVQDSGWEAIAAKTFDELTNVISYVKNSFLGFAIPYVKDGEDRQYFADFIVKVKTNNGEVKNLIVEITGMNKDKAEKKWYVENRWLPAVNSIKDKYEIHEWHFIEIANDIRNIKNQLTDKISGI